MRKAWNKGFTKETSESVRKMTDTFRRKKINNFLKWQLEMKERGIIKSTYSFFERNGDLAELIGVVLGDGTITKFPRTEALRIVGHWKNQGFINRYGNLVEQLFGKKPHIAKRKNSFAANITIYECHISTRLGIPTGAKGQFRDVLPTWIKKDREYTIRYLRGLYEAEGSYHIHQPTYTYKFLFSNTNPALLDAVFLLVTKLGFHPHRSKDKIQISRRLEVQNLKDLLEFRNYKS